MSTEARELHRIIRANVRDMLDAYRMKIGSSHAKGQSLGRAVRVSSGRA